MAHIALPAGVPGVLGPMLFRPETARPLNALADTLLECDGPLDRGERALIASYVARLDGCRYNSRTHRDDAVLHLAAGADVVDAALRDPATAPIGDRLRALLAIAGRVQQGGMCVTASHVEAARRAGATDVEVHDTVLLAAAICMFDRYVDGLGTFDREVPAAAPAPALASAPAPIVGVVDVREVAGALAGV